MATRNCSRQKEAVNVPLFSSFVGMPPSVASGKKVTESALKSLIEECIKHPEKRAGFVEEGSVELLIGEQSISHSTFCGVSCC